MQRMFALTPHSCFGFSLGIVAILLLSGCDRLSTENVTNSRELWGGYAHQEVYKLKQDVFLIKLDPEQGPRFALSPEGLFDHTDRFYSVPKSVQIYKQNPGQASNDVVGRSYNVPTTTIDVVKAGTRIRCSRLMKNSQWSWFFGDAEWTTIFAEILDGPHSGTLVDITDLSIRKKKMIDKSDIAIYESEKRLLTRINK